jgi:hypothetical protein
VAKLILWKHLCTLIYGSKARNGCDICANEICVKRPVCVWERERERYTGQWLLATYPDLTFGQSSIGLFCKNLQAQSLWNYLFWWDISQQIKKFEKIDTRPKESISNRIAAFAAQCEAKILRSPPCKFFTQWANSFVVLATTQYSWVWLVHGLESYSEKVEKCLLSVNF